MSLLSGNQNTTPLLHSLQVSQSLNGIVIPIMYGTNRVAQNLLGYWDFTSGQPYQSGGKGLGKTGNAYEYYAAVLGALCQGTASGVLNVYSSNGRLQLSSTSESYVVPPGGGSYTVQNQSSFAADSGAAANVPYNVTANDYGAPNPVTLTGTYQDPQNHVIGSPGAGQYSQSNGTYTFPASAAGQEMTMSYVFSLYTLSSTEDYNIPPGGGEITVQYAPEWQSDQGVIFVSTGAALSVGSGPGQYTTDGHGNYFFNVADANQAIAISYFWNQSNSNVDPASQLNFTLIEGTFGQEPWTYLTSKHASQAFGYSTIVCIGAENMDLGESATLPNYNFEIMMALNFGGGILDAGVADCILDLLTNPFYGAGFVGTIDASLATVAADYWNSNGFFISPVLNSSQSCSSIIEEWLEAGNCGVYWSEGLLKFAPYGDTTTVGNGYLYTPQTAPVVDLDDDDFFAQQDEDPVSIERTPWQDAYNSVKIQYTNRINAYNDDLVQETDDYAIGLFGLRPEPQQDYSFLCTQTAATFSANIRIQRLVYIRGKYHFTISALRYCFLEPMDLVTLTDIDLGLNKTPVRITETEENENYELECTAEEFPWGTATATIYPKQPALPPPPPPALADPGNTNVVSIFEPTTRVAVTLANSAFQIWIAMNGGPNWGGCNVWLSKDGSSYQQIGVQSGPSRAGVITADLPEASSPDLTNTLAVSTSGQLFNVTEQQANALSTISKVGTEYLSYANATITGSDGIGTNDYDLTYLVRGAFSSPNVAHDHTDPNENQFIRLDSQIFTYSFDPSLAGQTIYFKFTSFNLLQNQVQQLADVQAYPYTVIGVNLSSNMTVDAVVDISGLTADIRIYQTGKPVGTAGSAELDNGANVILPAVTVTGKSLGTLYYANFNPNTNSYVLYTDQNAWLVDEQTNNYIRIGQIMTPSDFSYIPLMGGGTLAIGASWGPSGSSISIPSGFSPTNLVAFATIRNGFDSGIQVSGVYSVGVAGTVLNGTFRERDGSSAISSNCNWVAATWTPGAAVSVTTVGAITYISFTTANGDELCIASGVLSSGAVPVPSGFLASQFLWIAGMSSTNPTGNGLQYIRSCSLDPSLNLTAIYDDNQGNRWGGGANVFGVFWKTGGNVTESSVLGGKAITIPLLTGSSIALVQAQINSGGSFGVPSAFSSASVVSSAAMGFVQGTDGDDVAHGWTACQTNGFSFTGTYADGSGNSWTGGGNIFAIATV